MPLRLLWFVGWLPLALLVLACESGKKFLSCCMGFGEPRLQALQCIKQNWKHVWGIEPVSGKLDVIQGYMYTVVTYSDGSKAYFR